MAKARDIKWRWWKLILIAKERGWVEEVEGSWKCITDGR